MTFYTRRYLFQRIFVLPIIQMYYSVCIKEKDCKSQHDKDGLTHVESRNTGLNEEPHLLQGQLPHGVLFLQLSDQYHVLFHKGLDSCTQRLIHLILAVFYRGNIFIGRWNGGGITISPFRSSFNSTWVNIWGSPNLYIRLIY